MRTTRFAARCLLLLLPVAGGCHRDAQPSVELSSAVYSIHVEPASLKLPAGTRAQLAAEARDADGAAIGGAPLSFESADLHIAAVTPTGVVTATGAVGATHVIVRSGSAVAVGKVPIIATAGPPARIEIVDQPHQAAVAGEALGRVRIRVVDAYGNPVAAVPLDWRVTGGGGSIDQTEPATDAQGFAGAFWHADTRPGSQRLEIAGGGVPPVAFVAQVHAAPTATVSLRLLDASGEAAADPVLRIPMSLVALASDRHGNPIAGAAIVLAPQERCGFPGAALSTDATGATPAAAWTPSATGTCEFAATVGGTDVSAILKTRVAARATKGR